jgi:hypothetical protein
MNYEMWYHQAFSQGLKRGRPILVQRYIYSKEGGGGGGGGVEKTFLWKTFEVYVTSYQYLFQACSKFSTWLCEYWRPYSKSSLTLNEWRFNPSFSWVSMLFLNSWRVSSHIVRYDTSAPAIQKQRWRSREAQIEPPLIECEWAFRIRAWVCAAMLLYLTTTFSFSQVHHQIDQNVKCLIIMRIEAISFQIY